MLIGEGISYSYPGNKRVILDDVTFGVHEGEIRAVMGESGIGKSTLLAVLAGILRPDKGTVKFNDTDIYSLDDRELSAIHRNDISYVPQSNIMMKHLTVAENIIDPFLVPSDPGSGKELRDKAQELMDKLGVGDLIDQYPYELSGGELKRVSLVRAAIMSPSVIIADEPTTGLDKDTGDRILGFLSDYSAGGNAVIVATHDENIARFTDKILRSVKSENYHGYFI